MLSNSEILLDQVFRVWIRGDGYDYNVVLTPVSLLLEPTASKDPGKEIKFLPDNFTKSKLGIG